MKIFITGASGKIGKNLSNFLINKNYFCILNSRKKIKIKVKKKAFIIIEKIYWKKILQYLNVRWLFTQRLILQITIIKLHKTN